MRLAKVVGQVVATVRSDGPAVAVAVDKLGAGEGEWVLTVAGSSARMTVDGGGQAPVDLSVIGIVDEVTSEQATWFQKHS